MLRVFLQVLLTRQRRRGRALGIPDGLFVLLPAPTTAEVEELTQTVAGRLADRLSAASEKENDYLDPELAALVEARFW
jgi:hypothetical protein